MLTSWSAENDLLTLTNDLAGTANDAGYTHTFTPAHQWATSSISNAAFKYTPPTGTATAYGGANAVNQVPTIGGTAMAYDTRGNLTTDGTTGTTYLYDAENRMMSATRAGATSTYAYDPMGRRTSKTVSASTTSFVYDGDAGIADYGGGTLARRFVPGPDIDNYIATVSSSGAIKFYHTDKMGSIVAMSDVNGNLAEGPYVYDAYGNCFSAGVACSAGVGFRYTGQRLDPETGLYYYRARYYQPGIGQFLQTDPVGYNDNLDLYSYVGDDPTDATDPMGTQVVCLPDGCVYFPPPPPPVPGTGTGENKPETVVVTANRIRKKMKELPVFGAFFDETTYQNMASAVSCLAGSCSEQDRQNLASTRGAQILQNKNSEKANDRKKKKAKQEFRTNRRFRNWFHKNFKGGPGGQGMPVGDRHNPDLDDDQILEAWEEYQQNGGQ
jgi:RHS repeat-associated protein